MSSRLLPIPHRYGLRSIVRLSNLRNTMQARLVKNSKYGECPDLEAYLKEISRDLRLADKPMLPSVSTQEIDEPYIVTYNHLMRKLYVAVDTGREELVIPEAELHSLAAVSDFIKNIAHEKYQGKLKSGDLNIEWTRKHY